MKNLGLLLLCFIAIATHSFAQTVQNNKAVISVSIFNENFGLSPFPQGNPLHLGGTVAIAFTKKQNGIYRKSNNVELGYFKHESVFQAIYLAWKPQYEWQFNNGFQLHTITGLGYAHIFPSQTTFVQNDGIYEAATNLGKPGGVASFGLGLGYQFGKNSGTPVTLFARQEFLIIAPFLINESFPLSANSTLKLGVTIQLF